MCLCLCVCRISLPVEVLTLSFRSNGNGNLSRRMLGVLLYRRNVNGIRASINQSDFRVQPRIRLEFNIIAHTHTHTDKTDEKSEFSNYTNVAAFPKTMSVNLFNGGEHNALPISK